MWDRKDGEGVWGNLSPFPVWFDVGFGIKWSRGDGGRSGSAGKTIHCARSARWTWSNIRGPGNHHLKVRSSNGGGGGGVMYPEWRPSSIWLGGLTQMLTTRDAFEGRLWGGPWGDMEGGGGFFLFFFFHGEHCTGAFRSARTKGTWGPLSNRCVHSAEERRRRAVSNHFTTVGVSASMQRHNANVKGDGRVNSRGRLNSRRSWV